jgi:hypothetical protein
LQVLLFVSPFGSACLGNFQTLFGVGDAFVNDAAV